MSAAILLGTQGWNYPAWTGPFYPGHTKPSDFLVEPQKLADQAELF